MDPTIVCAYSNSNSKLTALTSFLTPNLLIGGTCTARIASGSPHSAKPHPTRRKPSPAPTTLHTSSRVWATPYAHAGLTHARGPP